MQFLDLTLSTLAENVALDEALLEQADGDSSGLETLRVWQSTTPCVVLGRSSRVGDEVDQAAAADEGAPIIRRVSGGASVVAGPGCMFYALILSLVQRPHLRMLDQAHQFVMTGLQDALQPWLPEIALDGTCDLVLNNKKIGGNSVRVARNWMLYHGTLLLEMDLSLIDRLLKHPPREPEYRRGRSHLDFVDNCHLPYARVAGALQMAWNTSGNSPTIASELVEKLVQDKYSQPNWNLQR